MINPAEFLEDIVIEHEYDFNSHSYYKRCQDLFFLQLISHCRYVECTASAMVALSFFSKLYPGHRQKEIDVFITKAIKYLENTQREDGSWYGNWGICFIYGTWFALRGLAAVGMNWQNNKTVRKGCDFLLSKQLECGGWGESYRSSPEKVFILLEDGRSNLVHTAWALMGLINSGQVGHGTCQIVYAFN